MITSTASSGDCRSAASMRSSPAAMPMPPLSTAGSKALRGRGTWPAIRRPAPTPRCASRSSIPTSWPWRPRAGGHSSASLPDASPRKRWRTTSSPTGMRRRGFGCGQAPPSKAPTWRRCCRGSTGRSTRPAPRVSRRLEGDPVAPRVLIADELSPRALEVFAARGIEADVRTGLDREALIEAIPDYDGLVVRSATRVTAKVIDAADRLRVIGRAGIGVDNIDLPAATAKGVIVMNTPFGNSITTAEHAISLMLALARQIPAADRSTRAGKWEKNRFVGVEITGKTLGIIGCGNIGSIVADRALGLKMRVIAYDPFLSPERAVELGVEKVELDALLSRADFISLHTPLTDKTRNIIDRKALARTRRGVRIINCARGGLIVEADLKDALLSDHVAGAALDVYEQEPAIDNPLFELENVICTPHLGASTREAQENVALQIAEQIADYLTSGAVTNALNMPSISAEEAPKLAPYVRLAEQLGLFAGQLTESSIASIDVEYAGEVAEMNTRALTAALLTGLLRP